MMRHQARTTPWSSMSSGRPLQTVGKKSTSKICSRRSANSYVAARPSRLTSRSALSFVASLGRSARLQGTDKLSRSLACLRRCLAWRSSGQLTQPCAHTDGLP